MLSVLRGLVAALYRSPPLLLLATAMSWGANTLFGQLAVGEIGPLTVVMARWLIVAAILWPLFGAEVRAAWPTLRPHLPRLVPLALCGFTGFNTLFYFSAYHTTAINIGIIQGAAPIVVILGAYLFFAKKPGLVQIFGVVLTIIGVALVTTKGDVAQAMTIGFNFGDLLILLATALYAIYTLALTRRPDVSGRAFFTFMAMIAAASATPLGLYEILATDQPAPTAFGWLIALAIAIFPSMLAQLFFLQGVDLIGPSRAIVYINFVPVFGAVLAVAVLGEEFRWYHAAALALVTLGVFASQRTPDRR